MLAKALCKHPKLIKHTVRTLTLSNTANLTRSLRRQWHNLPSLCAAAGVCTAGCAACCFEQSWKAGSSMHPMQLLNCLAQHSCPGVTPHSRSLWSLYTAQHMSFPKPKCYRHQGRGTMCSVMMCLDLHQLAA